MAGASEADNSPEQSWNTMSKSLLDHLTKCSVQFEHGAPGHSPIFFVAPFLHKNLVVFFQTRNAAQCTAVTGNSSSTDIGTQGRKESVVKTERPCNDYLDPVIWA